MVVSGPSLLLTLEAGFVSIHTSSRALASIFPLPERSEFRRGPGGGPLASVFAAPKPRACEGFSCHENIAGEEGASGAWGRVVRRAVGPTRNDTHQARRPCSTNL